MKKILQNILFSLSTLILIAIVAYLAYDNFLNYKPLAIINIVNNIIALFIGGTIVFLMRIDDKSKLSDIPVEFSLLLSLVCFTCTINTIECIVDGKDLDINICMMIDAVRVYCEIFMYYLTWKYVCFVIKINNKRQKIFSALILIIGIICASIYVALFFVSFQDSSLGFMYEYDLFHLPIIVFHFFVSFVLILFIVKHNNRIFISIALFVLCVASVVILISFVFILVDVGYLVFMITLLICYVYIYLNNVYDTKQGELIGKEYQKSLLTDNFDIMKDKIDVFAKTLPAGEVGGNFYDIYNKDGRYFTFCLADTPGVGLPAALTMTSSISLLRGLIDTSKHVNGIAQQMSYRIRTDIKRDTQISLWLGTIDVDTNTLSYVNAGDCVFLFMRSGKFMPFNYRYSNKIGSPSAEKYRANEVDFLPGDMIILFTQNMKQIKNSNSEFISDESIQEILRESNLSSKQYCERIFDYIKKFTDHKAREEDITLLILQYKKDSNQNISNVSKRANVISFRLNIGKEQEGDCVKFKLKGDLVKQTYLKLDRSFEKMMNVGHIKSVLLDFDKVNSIDSYGMRSILKAMYVYPDIDIYINSYNDNVKNYLKDNGLDEILIKEV